MPKEANGLPDFSGPFRELIPEYIHYRRAQGYKLHDPIIYRLREMDLFFKEMSIHDICITREMYEAWTKPRLSEKETTTAKRCTTIRVFSKYLITKGYENIYTGFDDTRVFKTDFIPYIFSKDEITAMFKVLSSRCLAEASYENETFQLIMQMYYCCGFRKSELQGLRVGDIDFQTGKVIVLHGKNDVSRIIIVSDSLLLRMQKYQTKYLRSSSPEDYLFHGKKSRTYSDATLYRRFHQLLKDAGIKPSLNGGRQRLHDIRHTFCIRALEQMQEKGFDLYTSLPLLSTYLGHKHITETEYYLRMLDEHFGSILEKTAIYASRLFPKASETGGGNESER